MLRDEFIIVRCDVGGNVNTTSSFVIKADIGSSSEDKFSNSIRAMRSKSGSGLHTCS